MEGNGRPWKAMEAHLHVLAEPLPLAAPHLQHMPWFASGAEGEN